MHILCRVANATGIDHLHAWRKGRRVKGILARRCARCRTKQEWQVGQGWKTVSTKRVRKPKLQVQTLSEERQHDAERQMGPL